MKKETNYSDKLKNPQWQRRRLEILNLRGFKCEKCSCETKELHVHHRFYLKGREVWEYDNDVFQVLCCDCHEKEHSKQVKQVEVIPEKYAEIIKFIDEIDQINIKNSYIIMDIIDWYKTSEYDTFFEDLSYACASDSIEDIARYVRKERYTEEKEIGLWSKINELKHQVQYLIKMTGFEKPDDGNFLT